MEKKLFNLSRLKNYLVEFDPFPNPIQNPDILHGQFDTTNTPKKFFCLVAKTELDLLQQIFYQWNLLALQ